MWEQFSQRYGLFNVGDKQVHLSWAILLADMRDSGSTRIVFCIFQGELVNLWVVT